MKKILSVFVKYPFYGKMFIVVLLLIGGMSAMNMKKATFPMVESETLTVRVTYPGATPQQMEEGVTTLVENAIRGIAGIKEFSSKSMENSSVVTITSISNYDMDELLSDVKNDVDGISNFPSGAESPIVSKNRNTDMAMFITLTSTANDLHELNRESNRIEDDFLASGIMSQITIRGIPSNMELVIEVDETQMRRYNIDIATIKNAISSNNVDIHGGTIKSDREEIKIVSRERSVDPDDITKIVIRTTDAGRELTIGDVATVELTFAETPNKNYVDGRISSSIFIQKLMNEDLEEISDYVNDYIVTYNEEHATTQLRVNHDFMENINSQLSTLIGNGVMGAILIVIMLSLLLNFRLSLWVAWGIPASFLGMFILGIMYGTTLNIISLFGMILIVGILVDDGVVIGENIFSHYEKGKSPRRAAIDGTLEVLPAVFASVITTIVAFLPLFFIEGHLRMMAEMAFVVIASLLISLVEGVFVLPGHLANPNVLKPINPKSFYGKIRSISERLIAYLKNKIYLPFLSIIMKHRGIALAAVSALIILTVGLVGSGKIAFVFFPGSPADHFTIDIALKPGANEELTKEKLLWIEQKVWEVNEELREEYHDTMSYVASSQIYIGSAFDGTETGTNAGIVRVFLNSLTDASISDDVIKQAISKKTQNIPEAYKYAVGASNRFGAPVSISLLGYDGDELDLAKNELEAELAKISSLYNVTNNSQLGSQEINLTLKPEAYVMGETQVSLMTEVRSAFYGGLAQRMQEGKNDIWVYVRYKLEKRKTIGDLEKMIIHTPKGDAPLSTLADINFERSLNTINRFNGRREIRVDAYMRNQSQNVSPILEEVEQGILPDILARHPGVDFMYQGQQKDSAEQIDSMVIYFGLAFLIIVIIVMVYFKSFRQGLMIILMIPLGFVGAVWGHGIHGQPISMMSIWGLIALSGTIINDAIVFMSKYNQNLVEGMSVHDSIIDAGSSRFRAIFLTTVTTVAGLMPLILANNPDARMLVPMAIALAYGILFGTLFILLVLPVIISIFNTINVHLNRMLGKEGVTPESVEVAVINHQIEETLRKNMEKEF